MTADTSDGRSDRRSEELARALARVRERIGAACEDSGRDDVPRLMVVTKFHPVEDVVRLVGLGADDFGENRAQEAAAKATALRESEPGADVRWSMIGHVQSKKTGQVAGWADEVQSVDSDRVAEGLDRGVRRAVDEGRRPAGSPLPVLVQLSLDGAEGRGGVTDRDVDRLADLVAGLGSVRLAGLMVVPPTEGDAAAHLRSAAAIHRRLMARHPGAVEFSAGMSADLEAAVAAGSTCVRVGTAILGSRPLG